MENSPDGIVLFSGGLDSILAAKVLHAQGLNILCAHFTTPFFGDPAKVCHWRKTHNLNIVSVDIGADFCAMLANGPEHGYGQTLNPCVDCKILLLKAARSMMHKLGARFLATGEVIGQRPMSQRRDSMDVIQKCAGVKGLLLRPLCALHLEPTAVEKSNLVDRSRLFGINGRGRAEQLALAARFALAEIPAPAGGCVLTEKENGRRYWPIIKKWRTCRDSPENLARDFSMARIGRQLWRRGGGQWLRIGRNAADNEALKNSLLPGDVTLKLRDFSGPLALARGGAEWSDDILAEAAAILAAYSARAIASGAPVSVTARGGKNLNLEVLPNRLEKEWNVPDWETTKAEIKQAAREKQNLAEKDN